MTDPDRQSGASPRVPIDSGAGVFAYLHAVDALVAIGRQFGPEDWQNRTACTDWDATALVGHVLCVARWHHEWLDRAEGGETSPPWPARELAARNQAALDDLDVLNGPSRLAAFQTETRAYAERLPSTWHLPLWYPGGLLSVGMHSVLATGEWHFHAWDLARAIGVEHSTDGTLLRDVWLSLERPVAADGDAWQALLDASGRTSVA